jgi:hypothetical protein
VAVKLNQAGNKYARKLFDAGKVEIEADWSINTDEKNTLLGDPPDWKKYSKWFLGIDTEANEETRERYKYPFGKNGKLYRKGLTAIRQRAGQQKENDIFDAAGKLLEDIDEKVEKKTESKKRVKHNIRTTVLQKNKDDKAEVVLVEIQLIPFGTHGEGEDEFILDKESAELVIEAFNQNENDTVIDYEHQTLEGTEAPAAGWIKTLTYKDEDGIWGGVKWTEKAQDYIKKGEYKYISPVIAKRIEDNRVVELINAGLTNQPVIDGMEPVTAAKKKIVVNKDALNTDDVLSAVVEIQSTLTKAVEAMAKLHDLLAGIFKPEEMGEDNNKPENTPTNTSNDTGIVAAKELEDDLNRIEAKIAKIIG